MPRPADSGAAGSAMSRSIAWSNRSLSRRSCSASGIGSGSWGRGPHPRAPMKSPAFSPTWLSSESP
eukprot:3771283-Lingulodinium_polyedra.AAC.1